MSIRYFTSVVAVILLISLIGCTKETVSPDGSEVPLSAEAWLQQNVLQPVLFHFEYRNDATGELRGWFIDKEGKMKSYDMSHLTIKPSTPQGKECSGSQLANLYSLAQTTHLTLPADDIVKYFKQIAPAATGQLSTRSESNTANGTAAFYAFHDKASYQQSTEPTGKCGNGGYDGHGTPTFSGENFSIILLKSSGDVSQQNLGNEAQAIVSWLETVQASAGL
jgi:hypothetical protein